MSFLKFQDDPAYSGLHWQRADRDGAPFKGSAIPLLREEEFEDLAERVHDTKCGIFDISDPECLVHGRTYQQVTDGLKAGFFQLLSARRYKWAKRKGKVTMLVYVEWAETSMQLPKHVLRQLSTSVTPIEGEVSYGKVTASTQSQPRPLRQGATGKTSKR
jgi:hypothetical protein